MNQTEKKQSPDVAERMQLIVKHLGGNLLRIAKEIQANKDTFSRAVRDGSVSKTVLFGLSDKYKINPVWIMKGVGPMIMEEIPQTVQENVEEWRNKYILCIEEKNTLQQRIIELQNEIRDIKR